MPDIEVFSENQQTNLFEKSSYENGDTYWYASDLMKFLGYDDKAKFRKAITKSQTACLNLNLPVEENFISERRENGQPDTKLTRFACYLVSMNADPGKVEVARAQAYFVTIAESLRLFREEADGVMRVQLRGELTGREKSLSGVANEAGVFQFGLFQNAGYRGMYNMNISQLRNFRGIPDNRTPLDYMGKTELAANLFRITQTEEKLKVENVRGQRNCEIAAEYVGKEVRNTMKKVSNTAPEQLPLSDDMKIVKKQIKQTAKNLKRIDKRKRDSK